MMGDYRNTQYCCSIGDIKKRKNIVKKQVLKDHKKATDLHKYISVRDSSYKMAFIKAYNYKCAYCGVSLDLIDKDDFEIDHFIPESANCFNGKAEAGVIDNLILACRNCNRKKGDYVIDNDELNELNPDMSLITANFVRDDMYYIRLSKDAMKKTEVKNFYKKLHLDSEKHRLDYLLMSMIGMRDDLKRKGKDSSWLGDLISLLQRKRNVM